MQIQIADCTQYGRSSRDSFDANDEGNGIMMIEKASGIFIAKWGVRPLLSVEKKKL